MGRVHAKIALVTGANGGIGRGTCAILAEQGAIVFGFDIQVGVPAEGATPVRMLQVTSPSWPMSIAQSEPSVEQTGRLDVLVKTPASPDHPDPPMSSPQQEFDPLFAINARGTWLFIKYSVPVMLGNGGWRQHRQRFVDQRHRRRLGNSLYRATMAATGLMPNPTRSPTGARIQVNSAHPGLIETPMTDDLKTGPETRAPRHSASVSPPSPSPAGAGRRRSPTAAFSCPPTRRPTSPAPSS